MAENPPTGPAIQIEGLSKAFGRSQVLRGLELSVPWGERLTILGPNGSGKTTLIKVLATLTRPDRGTVRVGGLDVTRRGQLVRRMVGVVTHSPLLYDQLTGHENLTFFGRMFGLDRLSERIASAAEQMGMTARLHQRVSTLSHGLRKRLTIARALLHEPRLLLMDEPESGLDQEALAMLDAVIGDPAHPTLTVLMTTHNLERGLAVGQRLAILARGEIAHLEDVDSSTGTDALRDLYRRHTGAAL